MTAFDFWSTLFLAVFGLSSSISSLMRYFKTSAPWWKWAFYIIVNIVAIYLIAYCLLHIP